MASLQISAAPILRTIVVPLWLYLLAILWQTPAWGAERTGWYLIWRDEFDGPEVDQSKWRIEDAALVKNNEMQYYSPDEVYIDDGCLVLRSRARKMGNRDYTSGLVETRGKFEFLYGRVEVRAQLPRTQGMWPAHWMLPADGSWPPEIDIMESIGSQPNWTIMSLHNGKWPHVETQSEEYLGPDYSAGFHTFAVEWEPDEIRWYIDDELRFSTTSGIPNKPFFIILNTAVGGDLPGPPDETTEFPQYHRIDYVRVYARPKPGMFFLTTAARNGRIVVSPFHPDLRYPKDSKVVLRAIPSIGWVFDRWRGPVESHENPMTFIVNQHAHLEAAFVPDPNPPLLLSKHAKATASSVEANDLKPENAFDGDRKTRWSSAFSDPQWIVADLGRACSITAFRLVWENAFAKHYRLEVSDDGRNWQPVHETQNGRGGTEEIVKVNAQGRFVRLVGLRRATQWGYSLWELEVYGWPVSPNVAQAPESSL